MSEFARHMTDSSGVTPHGGSEDCRGVTTSGPEIQIVVVSDVRVVREAVAYAMAAYGGLRVAATARNAREAAQCVVASTIGAAIVDANMRDRDSVVRNVIDTRTGLDVIVVGGDPGRGMPACPESESLRFAALDVSLDDLARLIHRLHARQVHSRSGPIPGWLAPRGPSCNANDTPAPAALTPREQQVLTLLQRGLSNKEISKRLSIRLSTVKNHVHSILGKLNVRGRCAAIARLGQNGVTPPP